ncbi:MAG: LysM peptidoglycan-binding domain-containing protein [Deltaproteobacteria bacterium]|nr:LysM peptidoglycan-binding domain-containing protein [Deltaproteobacteria bacterium]
MKKFILLLAVIILMPMSVTAQETEKATGGEGAEKSYTVKKGDTLWDISDEFLKDPFKWPTVWDQNNEQIVNPHLIYPGQVIIIRPAVEKKVEEAVPAQPPAEKIEEAPKVETAPQDKVEEKPQAEVPPALPQKKTFIYPGIETTGFIVPDGFTYSGSIIDSKEDKVMLSSGDEIYINIGEDKGAKKGDRYSIYGKAVPIYHPVSKKLFGHQLNIIGILEIEKVHEKLSEGRITASYDTISKGDKIVTYEPMPSEIEVKKGEPRIEGLIIANRKGSVDIAEGDIVFMDMGKRAGLEVGNTLVVSLLERMTDKKQLLPAEDVGSVLVITTREDSSTALVIGSKKPFRVGDKVRMEK